MRMIRWTRGIKVIDRFTCSKLRERLGLDYIITVVQQHRLRWYGHVLRKDENDWVKKYVDYEVKGVRPKGRRATGQRNLGVRLQKKIVQPNKYARKMLWTI